MKSKLKNVTISESRLVYLNIDGGISVFDAKTNVTKELLDNSTFVSNLSYTE